MTVADVLSENISRGVWGQGKCLRNSRSQFHLFCRNDNLCGRQLRRRPVLRISLDGDLSWHLVRLNNHLSQSAEQAPLSLFVRFLAVWIAISHAQQLALTADSKSD